MTTRRPPTADFDEIEAVALRLLERRQPRPAPDVYVPAEGDLVAEAAARAFVASWEAEEAARLTREAFRLASAFIAERAKRRGRR